MLTTIRRALSGRRPQHQHPPAPKVANAVGFEDLPPDVRAELDLADVMLRNGCAENEPRALMLLPGANPWFDGAEETPKVVARLYPELSAEQVEIASKFLRRLVRHRKRLYVRQSRGPNWVTSWRYPE